MDFFRDRQILLLFKKQSPGIDSLNHLFCLNRIIQEFFHKTFYIYEKVFPFTDRPDIAVCCVWIVRRNHCNDTSIEALFLFTQHHKSVTTIAVSNLKIIMKMKIIHIIPVILDPLLSKKCQDRTSRWHLVISELHLRFSSFFCHLSSPFQFKSNIYLFIVLYIFQQKKITFYNFGNLFLSLYFNYYLFLLTISPTT